MLQDIAESGEDIDFILVEEMIKRYKKDPAFKNEVLKDGKVTPKEFMTFAKKHNVKVSLSDFPELLKQAKEAGIIK